MILVRMEERELGQYSVRIVSPDWIQNDLDLMATALAKNREKAEEAAQHLLNRLIYDACEALQDMGRLTQIQEFAIAVLLEDPECQDAAKDVLGI